MRYIQHNFVSIKCIICEIKTVFWKSYIKHIYKKYQTKLRNANASHSKIVSFPPIVYPAVTRIG